MNYAQVVNYREPTYGVISNQKYPTDKSTDNAALFTAEYILQLDDPSKEKDTFKKFIDACQIEPGLYSRYPGDPDLNSWDNYIGVVAASKVLGLGYHFDVLEYGDKHDWCYNNVTPGTKTPQSWLGRYPALIPFLRMACGHDPSPEEEMMFIGSCEVSTFSPIGDESGKCLQYVMNRTVFGAHPEIDLAIWVWRLAMMRKYPGGLSDLYGHYFGAGHPLAMFTPNNFD